MPLETDGFDGLMTDIAGMARRMDADGEGAGTAKRILEAAAVPIHQQMKANATRDPRIPTSVPRMTPERMSPMRSSARA